MNMSTSSIVRSFLFLCAVLLFNAHSTEAQSRLKVYLDCSIDCDETYIKSEIAIVDFVLDRLAADVHILITGQPNGSGGSTIQLSFLGQNGFKDRSDKISIDVPVNATSVEERALLAHRIKLGLVPFLSNGAFAGLVSVNMKNGPSQSTKLIS